MKFGGVSEGGQGVQGFPYYPKGSVGKSLGYNQLSVEKYLTSNDFCMKFFNNLLK